MGDIIIKCCWQRPGQLLNYNQCIQTLKRSLLAWCLTRCSLEGPRPVAADLVIISHTRYSEFDNSFTTTILL